MLRMWWERGKPSSSGLASRRSAVGADPWARFRPLETGGHWRATGAHCHLSAAGGRRWQAPSSTQMGHAERPQMADVRNVRSASTKGLPPCVNHSRSQSASSCCSSSSGRSARPARARTTRLQQARPQARAATARPRRPRPRPRPRRPRPRPRLLARGTPGKAPSRYLETGSFSRNGLIKQLSSAYGEGFSKADAIYAVDHIDVDWNEQAAKAAKIVSRDWLVFPQRLDPAALLGVRRGLHSRAGRVRREPGLPLAFQESAGAQRGSPAPAVWWR